MRPILPSRQSGAGGNGVVFTAKDAKVAKKKAPQRDAFEISIVFSVSLCLRGHPEPRLPVFHP
jgi:hypothetical protein